jgi:hypothetical protein
MADTGEDREIKQRVNAKEAEIVLESKKLRQKSQSAKNRPGEFRGAKKKRKGPEGR